jgi:hypothetical protein
MTVNLPHLAICKFIHNISHDFSRSLIVFNTANTTAPLPKLRGTFAAVLTVRHTAGAEVQYSTVPLIAGICNREKWAAKCMPCHLLSLKESLVSINKGLSGPQIQSRHSGENFQASPGAQSWNLIYSQQTYFPILRCLQMSSVTNPEVSTTEPNSS